MAQLQIKVLGTPEVRHEGLVLKFRSRKALALLLYLAVEGQRVTRKKISAIFWPMSDVARSTLRRTLADLRYALDDSHTHTHLIIERDALAVAFLPGDELDIRLVDGVFDLLRFPTSAQEQVEKRQELQHQIQQIVQISGDSFMEGFSLGDTPDFDDWVREQRAIYQQRMNLVYEWLAQMQADKGDVHAAIKTVGRWLVHDPFKESAYQSLMLLYFTIGNYRAALNTYEACRSRLAEELRALPLPETQLLAERVHLAASRDLRPVALARTLSLPLVSGRREVFVGEPSRWSMINMPMVGRASEHLALVEAYQAMQGGQTQIVFITGEAGIGKTRLIHEFLSWVQAHGADVLQARAFEAGGKLLYQLLVEIFRPRLELENAPDDLLSDTWLAELCRLFPELRDRYPDLPLVVGDEMTASIRLCEAITRLGQALAEKAPVVLFLDDLHWADGATLDVVYYAARHWQESHTPLMLLLNLRSENLTDWMSAMKRDIQAIHLQLDALTYEEIVHALETLELNSKPHIEELARWLFTETRGWPLYIIETLFEYGLLS